MLIKKLPKLGKGYVPQDLKKNSDVDLRILRWEQPQDALVQDQDQTPPVAPSTSAASSS